MKKTNKNDFDEHTLFATPVYSTFDLKNVDLVSQVAQDPIYRTQNNSLMSESFFHDERIFDFAKGILQSSWNILKQQGYLMENYNTIYEAMWLHTYKKHSYMEYHTHGNGNQIVGFYFLEIPENSIQLLLHDPRAGKIQTDLYESDVTQITHGSKFAIIKPQVGQLILTPSWLPHSITANQSDSEVKFVHINIQAHQILNSQCCPKPEVEVI